MHVFPVAAYPWRAFWLAFSILIAAPLAVVGAALAAAPIIPSWLFIYALVVPLGFMLSLLIALTALLLYSVTRNEITLRKGTLHLKGGAFHERIELTAITYAEIIDIEHNKERAPVMRENGLGLPGFQIGWFTLANGACAFVMRSGGKRMVYIETSQDFRVLLGVKNPEKLLAQIQA